jgi:hypothetical protein
MEQLKMATPDEAAAGLEVQVRVPDPGFVPMARVTGPDEVVAMLPRESLSVAPTVKAVPAVTLAGGWVVMRIVDAAAGLTVNEDELIALVTPLMPLGVAVNV